MAFTYRSSVAILILAVIVWLALATSAAQATEELDPGRFEAFVTAAIAADRVMEQWLPRIYGAESEAEAARLREQADAAMITAIEQVEGMTVHDYRSIYSAAQDDPELAIWLIELYQKQAGPVMPKMPAPSAPATNGSFSSSVQSGHERR